MRSDIVSSDTGLSPSKVCCSKQLLLDTLATYFTTSLPSFPTEIQFALYPVRSLLLRVSLICFLFLPVLRCFNSQRILPSRDNSGIPGSKPACGSPRLIAACHAFLRYQNQAIHLTALIGICFKLNFSKIAYNCY